MIQPLEWGADNSCAISWHNVIQYIFSHPCCKQTAGQTAATFSFSIIPLSFLSLHFYLPGHHSSVDFSPSFSPIHFQFYQFFFVLTIKPLMCWQLNITSPLLQTEKEQADSLRAALKHSGVTPSICSALWTTPRGVSERDWRSEVFTASIRDEARRTEWMEGGWLYFYVELVADLLELKRAQSMHTCRRVTSVHSSVADSPKKKALSCPQCGHPCTHGNTDESSGIVRGLENQTVSHLFNLPLPSRFPPDEVPHSELPLATSDHFHC